MATIFRRGGQGKEGKGNRYYFSYFDHLGNRITKSARTTDKGAAERIAAKYEADAALRRDGVIDPRLDRLKVESQRTIESHLVDFEAKMVSAGRAVKHVRSTLVNIRNVCQSCNMTRAMDLDADAINRYTRQLLDNGKSFRTVHSLLTSLKQFSRWLLQHQKLAFDPLASIRKPNPKMDPRRQRRMLLPEEWTWLRRVTLQGKFHHRMEPTNRVLLYALAIQTGLRSGELRSLKPGQVILDATSPYILCDSSQTKNRKPARQYITQDVAVELKRLVASREPWSKLFTMPDPSETSKMLKVDLAEARRKWLEEVDNSKERKEREVSDFLSVKNHSGQELDFHALRHTCGAWLAKAGNHPKVVQTIMRHSSITLTMDTYGHLFPGQEAEAVAKIAGNFLSLSDLPRP